MTNGEYLKRSRDESNQRLTPQYIQGQITYHQTGAEYYAEQGQPGLAEWSLTMVAEWRAKLAKLAPENRVSRDGKMLAAEGGQ